MESDKFTKKTLTIGIPTYNRASILEKSLPQLARDIGHLSAKVSIIISDNCSVDDTSRICESWIQSVGHELDVKYFRNQANIGVSRNLVSLFYRAKTPYFMFLGDDDRLNPDFFPNLISILESENRPSAVVQSFWHGKSRTSAVGYVGFPESLKLFYEYGNAWAGVVDTAAAVNALESRNLRSSVEEIVWPQTVMGYLAMHDLQPRPIYLASEEIGSNLVGGINLCNKAYWKTSLFGLLKAAMLTDKAIGDRIVRRSFLSYRCTGFISHLKAIALSTLIEGGEQTQSPDVGLLLRKEFGLRGVFWWVLLLMAESRYCVYLFGRIFWIVGKRPRVFAFDKEVRQMRLEFQSQVRNAAQNNKRFGDWF